MIRLLISGFYLLILTEVINAQDFIPLWPVDNMPNSRGIFLEEVIVNERIQQVDTPGIYPFFPAKEENTGSAVIICPSGGYQHLTYILGGFQMAKWFNTIGITAFVLKYRLPHSDDLIERAKGPLQDAQRAMRIIRVNAEKWGIKTDKIGVMGASAGGHLASTLGTFDEDVSSIGDALDNVSYYPNFMILISPVISMGKYTHEPSRDNLFGEVSRKKLFKRYSSELNVSASTPPCFIVHAADDKSVRPENSLLFYQALTDNNVSGCSLHIFPHGGHSINIRNNPGSTKLWTELCEKWLIEIGIIN